MTDISSINLWHKRARPQPDHKGFNVQLGCHLEEVVEMLDSLEGEDAETRNVMAVARMYLNSLATKLKKGKGSVYIKDRVGFADAGGDQIVTAVGVMHCADMDPERVVEEVNTSNWSKTVDGEFVFDSNGKIAKPLTYKEPDLAWVK